MKNYGEITFEKGFNLKRETSDRLTKMGLPFKSIKHYISSPYQANRYKPEFIGQEVWIRTERHKNTICFTQTDFDCILKEMGNEGLNDYLYSIVA